MSIRLYYHPFSRASRVRWTLEELEAPYELEHTDMVQGAHKADEYLDIHPLGQLPAILDGDTPIFESSAICVHLTDRFAERGLAPAFGSTERGTYYQWCFYAQVTLEIPVFEYFRQVLRASPGTSTPEQAQALIAKLHKLVRPVDYALANGPYLLGDVFSTADILVGSVLSWANQMGMLEGQDTAKEYVEQLLSRPAYQRSNAR